MGEFDLSVGTYLLGLFVNTFLFGLVTYQFLVYKNTVFNDPLWIKSVVGVLFFLDVVHSAVQVYAAWDMCVANYANPAYLLEVTWVTPFTASVTGFCALLAQGFLGHRVWILTKSKILVAVIGFLSFMGCLGGFIAGIKSGIIAKVSDFPPLKPYVIMWLGFQTAADIVITVSLASVLSRSRTGFRRTDNILNRLIRGAIQTGFFVSVFALGDLFSFLFYNDTFLWGFFAFPLGRIYTNTMLDTLNSRRKLKAQFNGTVVDMDTESNAGAYRMQNSKGQVNRSGVAAHTLQSINVTKDVVTVTDAPDVDGDAQIKSSNAWYPQ